MKILTTSFLIIVFVTFNFLLFGQTSIPKDNKNESNPGMILTSGAGVGSKEDVNQSPQGSLKGFVNMQTGALTYNVPITTISSYHLSVPVSLSYYSNGTKVDQESWPIGLGWSLNAGGAITRIKKGLPDESENGFLIYGTEILNFDGKSENDKKDFARRIMDGEIDSQPDIFHVAAPGLKTYFVFSNNGQIVLYPFQKNIEIEYYTDNLSGRIANFVIKTGDGTKYTFGNGSDNTVERIKTSTLSVPLKTEENRTGIFDLTIYTEDENATTPCYEQTTYDCLINNSEGCYTESSNGEKFVLKDLYSNVHDANAYTDLYSSVETYNIDYDNIKEEIGEWYNVKWVLTRIEHASGDVPPLARVPASPAGGCNACEKGQQR